MTAGARAVGSALAPLRRAAPTGRGTLYAPRFALARTLRVPSRPRDAPVAQLDRVSASEAEGHWFESSRARHFCRGAMARGGLPI